MLRWFAARVTSWMTGISLYACAVHWKTRGDGALTTVMFAIGGMPLRLSSTLAATNAVRLSLSCFAGGVAAVVSLGRRRLRGVDELAREPNG